MGDGRSGIEGEMRERERWRMERDKEGGVELEWEGEKEKECDRQGDGKLWWNARRYKIAHLAVCNI